MSGKTKEGKEDNEMYMTMPVTSVGLELTPTGELWKNTHQSSLPNKGEEVGVLSANSPSVITISSLDLQFALLVD